MLLRRGPFIAGALAAAACSPGKNRSPLLRVAFVPVLAAAPAMIAQERGFFKDAGLAVELIAIATAQDAVALLARGHLDAAVGGLSAAFFNAVRRGFKVRIAGSITYMPAHGHPTALLARTDLYDAGVRAPQDLRERRVGLIGGYGTSSSYYLGRMIEPLTFKDVELIPLNGGDQGIALKRKSIAAAFAWNPFTQAFERNGLGKVIAVPPGGTSTSALLFGERLLADASAGKAVFGAFDRAVTDISAAGYYRPENLAAMSKYIGQPAAALAKEDRYVYEPGMPVDVATLESMQRLFIAEKTLSFPDPLPVAQMVARP